jgi:phosphodiesterase/alkaline phosphatase D-like protein
VPEANTGLASTVYATSAVLNGTVSPNGLTTTYYFEYGTTTAYGLATANRTTDADASVSETVSGLSADTTYHYRLVATNSSGTSYGSDRSFQTASTDPAPISSGGGGGGGGCFLTTTAAGMDPGARK